MRRHVRSATGETHDLLVLSHFVDELAVASLDRVDASCSGPGGTDAPPPSLAEATTALARTLWRPERPDRFARGRARVGAVGADDGRRGRRQRRLATRMPLRSSTTAARSPPPSCGGAATRSPVSCATGHRTRPHRRHPRPQPPRLRHRRARRRQGRRRHRLPQHLVRRSAARRRRRPRRHRHRSSTTASSPRSSPTAAASRRSAATSSPSSARGGRSVPFEPTRRAGRQIVLTSGTTGRPKGAGAAGRGVGDDARGLLAIPLRARDTVVIAAPLFHAWGLAHLGVALATSTTAVVQALRPGGDAGGDRRASGRRPRRRAGDAATDPRPRRRRIAPLRHVVAALHRIERVGTRCRSWSPRCWSASARSSTTSTARRRSPWRRSPAPPTSPPPRRRQAVSPSGRP